MPGELLVPLEELATIANHPMTAPTLEELLDDFPAIDKIKLARIVPAVPVAAHAPAGTKPLPHSVAKPAQQ